jgi:hypothetical protein
MATGNIFNSKLEINEQANYTFCSNTLFKPEHWTNQITTTETNWPF